jgi:ATP-dependent Zn protease
MEIQQNQPNPINNEATEVNSTTVDQTKSTNISSTQDNQSKTEVVNDPKKENWLVYGLIVLGVIIIAFVLYWFFIR